MTKREGGYPEVPPFAIIQTSWIVYVSSNKARGL
jgi:hypothetical protein